MLAKAVMRVRSSTSECSCECETDVRLDVRLCERGRRTVMRR